MDRNQDLRIIPCCLQCSQDMADQRFARDGHDGLVADACSLGERIELAVAFAGEHENGRGGMVGHHICPVAIEPGHN